MTLTAFIAQRRIQLIDGLVRRFSAAREILHSRGDLITAWPELADWLCNEFSADGAVLCIEDQALAQGLAIEPEALAVLDDWFLHGQGEYVWLADSLVRQVPAFPCSEVAGVLATWTVTASIGQIRIYLTRREHVHEVAWGGNPDKPVEHHDGQLGIAPRRSFEKWVEKRLGRCRPWDNETRLLGLKLRELLAHICHDV